MAFVIAKMSEGEPIYLVEEKEDSGQGVIFTGIWSNNPRHAQLFNKLIPTREFAKSIGAWAVPMRKVEI